jgi:hypothetical protein
MPMNTGVTRCVLGVAWLLLGACATHAPLRAHLASPDPQLQSCAAWFRSLDRVTDQAGVRDGAAASIPGFPYLRADRYHASFAGLATRDAPAFAQWVEGMRMLDQDARGVELANLPEKALKELQVAERSEAVRTTLQCSQKLIAADLADATTEALLPTRIEVKDHYVAWHRAVGLYPITRWPFYRGVNGWQQDTQADFEQARAGPAGGPDVRYVPSESGVYSRVEVAALVARVTAKPLRSPTLSRDEYERLFATFAPVFQVETRAEYDRIGTIAWDSAGLPTIDADRPVVYRKLGFTRYGDRALLQLSYVAWFSERPGQRPLDLLAGRLDGIVWRVTLAADGEPVIFDSIHPCGCFHMFFPTSRARLRSPPAQHVEWAFVPAEAPALADGSRLVLEARTATHYLRKVAIDPQTPGLVYAFDDYDRLRVLPLPDGTTRSLFAANGLIAGTERGERFLFWPMGVPSAGAMRQWGTHATAFVGRRHFDDANLIEERFTIE